MAHVGSRQVAIRNIKSPRQRGRAIAALAGRQHGVVATWQLLAFGLRRTAVARLVAAGRLHPLYRGVYAVGHSRLTLKGRWIAAVLARGPEALLSHRSAAALWGIGTDSSTTTDVTATRARHPESGITLHRARSIHPDDRATRDNIEVTAIPRTLLDLAEIVDAHRLQRAFEEAERLTVLDLRELESLLERSKGRHGLKPLVALLAEAVPAPHTRSELERRFLDLIRMADLPEPICNATVLGLEVDILWPDQRLVVELDGYGFHHHRSAFERDRDRGLVLEAAGYRVLRVTWRELHDNPGLVLEALRSEVPGRRTRTSLAR